MLMKKLVHIDIMYTICNYESTNKENTFSVAMYIELSFWKRIGNITSGNSYFNIFEFTTNSST